MLLKKKLLAACAGILLAGSSILVSSVRAAENPLEGPAPAKQEANPLIAAPARVYTHVGEVEGLPVVLQFTMRDTEITGTLMVGKQSFPVAGRLDPATRSFRGKWTNNGTANDFVADIDAEHGKLILRTNGKTVALQVIREKAPAPQPQEQPQKEVIDGPAPATNVEMVGGKFFNIPVPTGWRHMEAMGNCAVISPDGKSAYGLVGRPTRAASAMDFVKEILQGYNVKDVQVAAQQESDGPNGQKNLQAIVNFTGGDGVARTAMLQVMFMPSQNGQNFGMMYHAATPADQWAANGKLVTQLASQIKVIPQQQQPAEQADLR